MKINKFYRIKKFYNSEILLKKAKIYNLLRGLKLLFGKISRFANNWGQKILVLKDGWRQIFWKEKSVWRGERLKGKDKEMRFLHI